MILRNVLNNIKGTKGAGIAVATAMGGWQIGGRQISQDSAMRLSAVNRCVECISDSMSKLPVFVIDNKTKEHINHPLLPLLQTRPNEVMTPSVYKKLMEVNRLCSGNAYAAIYRNPRTGRPVELLPLSPAYVALKWDDSGTLWYIYTHPQTGEQTPLRQEDVIHYKAYSPDGIQGISVLSRAADVLDIAQAAQQYEGGFYTRNGQPAGVIKVKDDAGKEARDKIRREWERVYTGVDNAFRVAVMDLGMEYQPIGVSHRDAQFVESKAVSIEDIARFFGVPLYKLMAGKQAYASNEQNGIEYVVNTIHPTVTQYEEEDTYKLLPRSDVAKGLQVKRNMMAELRGDSKSRAEWYKIAREIGYFSVNDICDLEDTPHVSGGDTRNASLNYIPLDLFRDLSINRNEGGE